MAPGQLICVVDDDHSVRESLQGWLKSMGFAVETFASAEFFLAFPGYAATRCLILDIRMPAMSGIDLQRELAERHILIPIVFMTAYNDEKLVDLAKQSNAVTVLTKPFDEAALLSAIRSALART